MHARFSFLVLFILWTGLLFSAFPSPPPESLKIVDRSPTDIIVHGYSTSFHWPQILQRKINRHFGEDIPIRVKTATRGGTPIARWMDVHTGEPLAPWDDILRPVLKRSTAHKQIILAQQSLQWVYGERQEGIRSPLDQERIGFGADVLQRYAQLLHQDGADLVMIAMHIYKHPMEPEIGRERLALQEALESGLPYLAPGPDVWEPTRKHYPRAFAEDKLHPNTLGNEIMAHYWFAALLQHDGLDLPEWSLQEVESALDQS